MRTDPSAAPGAETEGRAGALNGAARPSLRDRHLCDKPSRPEAATEAAWSRTLFPYALPARFQFTLNQDMTTVQITISDALAKEAAAEGLLETGSIEAIDELLA